MLIVQKYGGSSIATYNRILNVAKRITDYHSRGFKLVIVLSAQGDMTDELIDDANKISKNPSKRELDMLLSIGEQKSVALLSMALNDMGFNAISLNAYQAGILSTSNYCNAKIKSINLNRINKEINNNNIVIVTGFQGINKYNDITTLGRGGSDTTAVAIAVAMKAKFCEIYTDVDGVYSADPRVVKNAKKLNQISYSSMLELSSLGAGVLHNRAVEIAKKNNLRIIVRSSFNNSEGTILKGE